MGYRMEPHPHHHRNRHMQDTATPAKVFVHNGVTADLAIPCWYREVRLPFRVRPHDRHLHDHLGWPDPRHPDRSCQIPIEHRVIDHRFNRRLVPWHHRYIDYAGVSPIHFLSEYEGYENATIKWLDEHEGITATAVIDPVDDWIVRVLFDVQDPNATDEPQEYRFSVYVNAPERITQNPKTGEAGRTQPARRDLVYLGKLVVLPSAYE